MMEGKTMELFSKRLRTLRMEKGMKQSELAEALHFSQGMASAYENGREPPFDVLVQIANYFDVSADYLLGLTSTRKQDTDVLMTETNRTADRICWGCANCTRGHPGADGCHYSIHRRTLSRRYCTTRLVA
jgi:DNA-binding XRE family transcriptional regulator